MLTADVQRLEPGSEVKLIEVDCTAFGGDVLRFHAYNIAHVPVDEQPLYAGTEEVLAGDTRVNAGAGERYAARDWQPFLAGSELHYAGDTRLMAGAEIIADDSLAPKPIYWQGNEYHAWPYEVQGLEVTGDGRAPQPTLSVGNVDSSITALCLHLNDLLQAKVSIHTTFRHYLDAANFQDGNPTADPTQERVETWYIEQKNTETPEVVSWALSSPADVAGIKIPGRQIHSLCEWCLRGEYRGADCGYAGPPVADEDGNPTDDPSKDQCGGLLSDCKLRFGENNELPFGGFPGSALLQR